MNVGLLVDLHGTLVRSNEAWLEALCQLDPSKAEFYGEAISHKRDRRELASIAGVDFETLSEAYHAKVEPRQEVVELVRSLSISYPMVLVSGAPASRVYRDMLVVPQLHFLRVYTKEDGNKRDPNHIGNILREMGWSRAFLIGNDLDEDFVEIPGVTPILLPDKRKMIYQELMGGGA